MERMTGIEPALLAWEASVLPLNYIRITIVEYANALQIISRLFIFYNPLYPRQVTLPANV